MQKLYCPVENHPIEIANCIGSEDKIFIHAHNDQVSLRVFYTKNLLFPSTAFKSFDLETGEVKWINSSNFDSVSKNQHQILLVESSRNPPQNSCDPNLPICEGIKITALDTNSGEIDWAKVRSNMYWVKSICSDQDVISLTGIGSHNSYRSEISVDAKTGNLLPEFMDSIGTQTSKRTTLGYDYSDVVFDESVSDKETIFLLTKRDSTLWAVDAKTNDILGYLEFSEKNVGEQTVLASYDDYVSIYFGETEQLFVVSFTLP